MGPPVVPQDPLKVGRAGRGDSSERLYRSMILPMLNRFDVAENDFLRALVDVAGDALMVKIGRAHV